MARSTPGEKVTIRDLGMERKSMFDIPNCWKAWKVIIRAGNVPEFFFVVVEIFLPDSSDLNFKNYGTMYSVMFYAGDIEKGDRAGFLSLLHFYL